MITREHLDRFWAAYHFCKEAGCKKCPEGIDFKQMTYQLLTERDVAVDMLRRMFVDKAGGVIVE